MKENMGDNQDNTPLYDIINMYVYVWWVDIFVSNNKRKKGFILRLSHTVKG